MEYSKFSRIILKAKIKGLAESAAQSRKLISASFGIKRNEHWVTKRAIGEEARCYQLAYAYARNIPYQSVEQHTGDQNPIDVDKIVSILSDITREDVVRWLTVQEEKHSVPVVAVQSCEQARQPVSSPPHGGLLATAANMIKRALLKRERGLQ